MNTSADNKKPTLLDRLLDSWLVIEVEVCWWRLQDWWKAWTQHD